MELTRKQVEGVKIALERYRNQEAYTCISGYAGTGKSTLVAHIVAALSLPEEAICYIAYTGKASLVLADKGCRPAKTAHKLLYKTVVYQGKYIHFPHKELPSGLRVVVVDEVSMLPKYLWDLLLTHKVHVIALGDPGQLPPIGENNGILCNPHVFLDEVMRQAQDSEIIRLTMSIREGKPLQKMQGEEIRIIDKKDLSKGLLLWGDQVLAGKNATRHHINDQVRSYLYGEESNQLLVEGEKVIALRNNWDLLSSTGDPLINGMIGTLRNIQMHWVYGAKPHYLITNPLFGDFHYDSGLEGSNTFETVAMDYEIFNSHRSTVTTENFHKFHPGNRPQEFDYGYCITCHKSQGSEYNKVVVIEEELARKQHAKWLYTAATRAKEKLVIVRQN